MPVYAAHDAMYSWKTSLVPKNRPVQWEHRRPSRRRRTGGLLLDGVGLSLVRSGAPSGEVAGLMAKGAGLFEEVAEKANDEVPEGLLAEMLSEAVALGGPSPLLGHAVSCALKFALVSLRSWPQCFHVRCFALCSWRYRKIRPQVSHPPAKMQRRHHGLWRCTALQ